MGVWQLRMWMRAKGVDMGVTSTQACANISIGHLVGQICSAPKNNNKNAQHTMIR